MSQVPAGSRRDGAASTDWMNAAWAKDLTDRLAAPAGSDSTDKPRTGLAGRDLLRNLSRSFR